MLYLPTKQIYETGGQVCCWLTFSTSSLKKFWTNLSSEPRLRIIAARANRTCHISRIKAITYHDGITCTV